MSVTSSSACKIISHNGGASYNIEIQYDDSPRLDRMQEVYNRMNDTSFLTTISNLYDAWQSAITDRNYIISLVDSQINYLNQLKSTGGTSPDLIAQEQARLTQYVKIGLEYRNRAILSGFTYHQAVSIKASYETEYAELARIGGVSNRLDTVWCLNLADGNNGRAVYSAGEFVPLYCLAYDPDKLYLPAKTSAGIQNLPLEGKYNLMDRYIPHDAAGFTFWNAALEPGFAKWKPILLKGSLRRNSKYPNCVDGEPKSEVYLNGDLSRFGYGTIYGLYKFPFASYLTEKDFQDGDEVVVYISSVSSEVNLVNSVVGYVQQQAFEKRLPVESNTPTGIIVGWANGPRTPDTPEAKYTTSCSFEISSYGGNNVYGSVHTSFNDSIIYFNHTPFMCWSGSAYYSGITHSYGWIHGGQQGYGAAKNVTTFRMASSNDLSKPTCTLVSYGDHHYDEPGHDLSDWLMPSRDTQRDVWTFPNGQVLVFDSSNLYDYFVSIIPGTTDCYRNAAYNNTKRENKRQWLSKITYDTVDGITEYVMGMDESIHDITVYPQQSPLPGGLYREGGVWSRTKYIKITGCGTKYRAPGAGEVWQDAECWYTENYTSADNYFYDSLLGSSRNCSSWTEGGCPPADGHAPVPSPGYDQTYECIVNPVWSVTGWTKI